MSSPPTRRVLQHFEAGNREWNAEALVYADGKVAYRQFLDPAEPTTSRECTWDDIAADWPAASLVNFGGAPSHADFKAYVTQLVVAREGGARGCKACGQGPVLAREIVESVHPVSGDSYGILESTCLACRNIERVPFADN